MFSTTSAQAYKEDTHENFSLAAVQDSALRAKPETLTDLGLKPWAISEAFPNSTGQPRTIAQLFQEGARFEDVGSRSLNHFYDPLRNRGLFGVNIASPDWALEDNADFGAQEFSYKDARGYLYQALMSSTEDERKRYFGRTFQTLGQVIHHIQDMAQPQHVRNDAHCDAIFPCLIPGGLLGLYNPSLYEQYTRDVGNLPYTGYSPAMFNTARKYWTGNGQGIADFSNHNFVSAGTNFTGTSTSTAPNPNYPSPNGIGAIISTRQITDTDLLGPSQPLTGEIDFIGTSVVDSYRPNPSDFNPRTSSYSLFDAELTAAGAEKTFTLNRFNFDAAHTFLTPRAVGYSAGLINYFFRGKLDFVAHPSTPGAYAIENLSNEAMNGTFELHYDDMSGNRAPVPGATWTLTLPANGQSGPLTFTGPTAPLPKTPGQYMLVFRGVLGQESDAVIGKLVKCTLKTDPAAYPPPVFTGNNSYESAPVAWLTREPEGTLMLNGYLWIKKHPIPPPELRCFPLPGPPFCAWYLYYPPSPYFNSYDPLGDRYTPDMMSGNEFIKVWIDLNGDQIYSNEELVYEAEYSPLLVGLTWYVNQLITINAPLPVSPQGYCQTMMRVALSWGAPPSGPYADWAYGSVVDSYVDLR